MSSKQQQQHKEQQKGIVSYSWSSRFQPLVYIAMKRVTAMLPCQPQIPQALIMSHPLFRLACDGSRLRRYMANAKSSECDAGDVMSDSRHQYGGRTACSDALNDHLYLQPTSVEQLRAQLWWLLRDDTEKFDYSTTSNTSTSTTAAAITTTNTNTNAPYPGDMNGNNDDNGDNDDDGDSCNGDRYALEMEGLDISQGTSGLVMPTANRPIGKTNCRAFGAVVVLSEWELTGAELVDVVVPALCAIGTALEGLHIPMTVGNRVRIGCLGALATACPHLSVLRLTTSCYNPDEWNQLGKLTSLEKLDLHRCVGFEDLSFITKLTNLRALSLRGTSVTTEALNGCISPESNIESIDLRDCREITDVSALKELKHLTVIALCSPVARGETMAEVSRVRAGTIKCMCLKSCDMITTVGFVASIPYLEELCLSDMKLRDADLQAIGQCKRINDLFITWSSVVGCLRPICQLRGLRRASLINAGVTDTIVEELAANCPGLTELNIARNAAVTSVNPLGALQNLQALDIQHTSVTPEGIRDLKACPRLNTLLASRCLSLDSLNEAVNTCNSPWKTIAAWGTQLTMSGIANLSHCTLVQSVDFTACNQLDDVNVLAQLPRITSINLSFTAITARGMQELARCQSLGFLSLRGCTALGDDGIGAVLGSIPRLRNLDLSESNITGAGLRGLGKSPALERLQLSLCRRVDNLSGLIGMQRLTHLIVKGNVPGLLQPPPTQIAVTLLKCPRLWTVHIGPAGATAMMGGGGGGGCGGGGGGGGGGDAPRVGCCGTNGGPSRCGGGGGSGSPQSCTPVPSQQRGGGGGGMQSPLGRGLGLTVPASTSSSGCSSPTAATGSLIQILSQTFTAHHRRLVLVLAQSGPKKQ